MAAVHDAIDAKPFDDVKVRQAFRLIVDREQMVQQVLSGQGRVANDLYAPYDPAYAKDLPQRKQDLEQAKSLLQQAGQANMTVELVTAPVFQGIVEAAQVFAEQAKGAGVTVKVRKVDWARSTATTTSSGRSPRTSGRRARTWPRSLRATCPTRRSTRPTGARASSRT